MDENERLVPYVLRLAALLDDERGAEILAELQKLAVRGRPPRKAADAAAAQEAMPADAGTVGIWDVVDTQDGPGLRRRNHDPGTLRMWADLPEVPGKGRARRVVLVGESSARGFLLDPAMTPCRTLGTRLEERAGPASYQCVDLAHTGASIDELAALLAQIPRIDPDVLVLYAGNNWSVPHYSVADLDILSRELAASGYAAMRDAFWRRIVLPKAQLVLARLETLLAQGVAIVIVIPEFNLREWVPPANIEVPVLPPASFVEWHALRVEAEAAIRSGHWKALPAMAQRMRVLDEGLSPVTGHLLGRALEALNDAAGARRAYEDSRDSVCGLLLSYSPRITRDAQNLLAAFCARHGLACVDLRVVLAAADYPELPDPRHFLDFCHLSDSGIDIAMSAVAAAIHSPRASDETVGGGTRPRATAQLDPAVCAASHVMAACYNAYNRQPEPVLRRHLEAAREIWPPSLELMALLRDLLEGVGPLWARPELAGLTSLPLVARSLEMLVSRRAESLGLWAFRSCLSAFVPARETAAASTAPRWIDLLEVPEGQPGFGHATPNFTAGRAYLQATSRRTRLYLSLRSAGDGEIALTYRMPVMGSPAVAAPVELNRAPIGVLPFAPDWTTASLRFAVDGPGIYPLEIEWPIAAIDYEGRRRADVAALACGDFPYVLPVHGEIHAARVLARV
jgi:hypothetical protein